ncbi:MULTISPECIES: AraC family transcriptional regulator [Pseudoalteromonas]|uniref:AraC family transcriptional regulator n=1 Tax=Pseudoalteromonas amylolytica TaxID=1859457 RepID=A0A1S1MNI9_9GAMM|nr:MULTISPECIES: GyrI-like domain-containing protein [Pseudoalteromonas]OHU85072.1 AraC family transcriptional regulator [Pseudoalteromonas sp. JW3]OHU89976.1 AraC family transcriptional regulator [Pseudoalteromonas amylolytica]
MIQKDTLEARIKRVCDFISHNLDKPMDLTELSEVAALSRFHFHRVFLAYTGVSVTKFVQLARLKRASFQLAFESDSKIIDVALAAQFDSAEAFSRAFKRTFSQTPSQFRQTPNWPNWYEVLDFTLPTPNEDTLAVEIIEFPQTPIAYLTHCGDPQKVYTTAGQFVAWRKQTRCSPVHRCRTFGMPNGDPNTMNEDDFRLKICGSLLTQSHSVEPNPFGVKAGMIPAMRCAKATHVGSHDTLENTIYALYQQWLPQSGEQLGEHNCFFEYLNLIHEVNECDLRTDVFLPLQ